jgi:hypothetical protein
MMGIFGYFSLISVSLPAETRVKKHDVFNRGNKKRAV